MQMLDRMLGQMDAAAPGSVHSVDSCLAEVEDLLSYCNDILGTGDTLAGMQTAAAMHCSAS